MTLTPIQTLHRHLYFHIIYPQVSPYYLYSSAYICTRTVTLQLVTTLTLTPYYFSGVLFCVCVHQGFGSSSF